MSILISGGLGYIGSHTAIELINEGKDVVIVDNLCNSDINILQKIKLITGYIPKFYNYDLRNKADIIKVFDENDIESVIHFSALKAVGESVEKPLEYYNNNIISTLVLLEVMREYKVKKFVFSSSATVYGDINISPISENGNLSVTNPYGRTKLIIEDILRDLIKSDDSWNIAILRYFNPIGAHESGEIGENPKGIPNNIMPYITKVAIGDLEYLNIYGDDYETIDGTGVRDYIHVVDLAKGHIKALNKLNEDLGIVTYNLGTGTGYSVLELLKTFENTNEIKIPYKIVGRRKGDIAVCYADPNKALKELGWKAEKNIQDMCRDSWNFQRKNK